MPLVDWKTRTITLHPGESEDDLSSALRFAAMVKEPNLWQIVREELPAED
ncbi:MAG TPA: hypothetical protein VFU50_01015 [Terriglobales bacterium]|nr:hypothetical protein [Terriglobales bacterium]